MKRSKWLLERWKRTIAVVVDLDWLGIKILGLILGFTKTHPHASVPLRYENIMEYM